jgi:hypothetical protein
MYVIACAWLQLLLIICSHHTTLMPQKLNRCERSREQSHLNPFACDFTVNKLIESLFC